MLPFTLADMVDVCAKLEMSGSIQVTSEKSSGKPAFASLVQASKMKAVSARASIVFIKRELFNYGQHLA